MKNATRSTHSKERYILAYQMIKKGTWSLQCKNTLYSNFLTDTKAKADEKK